MSRSAARTAADTARMASAWGWLIGSTRIEPPPRRHRTGASVKGEAASVRKRTDERRQAVKSADPGTHREKGKAYDHGGDQYQTPPGRSRQITRSRPFDHVTEHTGPAGAPRNVAEAPLIEDGVL